MASNKRTIYLGLDYSDFTGGVTEVNRKMQLLDSEFKLAQEQAKNYGTETDKLGLKHEYLTQKIALQNKKVEEAKKAYDAAISSGKASQKEIDVADKKLLDARTTLEKMNGELKASEKAIVSANEETRSFGDTIRSAASVIGVDVNPAVQALASKFDGVNASAGAAVLTMGTVLTSLASLSFSLAETADELLTTSSITGITTDELQKLQYASSFVDVEVSTMTGSITKLTRSMDDARGGSKELDEAFKKLHVRYKESNGELRDANEVFYETIDALGKVKNETERDALAMQLMGKSAKDLNPLIEAGSKRLKELGIEAEDLGLIMSDDTLASAGELSDAMDKFNNVIDGVKNNLGVALLPILTDVIDTLASIPAPVYAGIATFTALALIIYNVAKAAKSMAVANAILAASNTAVGATGATAAAGLSPLLMQILLIAGVAALFVGGVTAVIAGIKETTKAAEEAVNRANTTAQKTANTLQKTTNTRTYKNNAVGTDDFDGGYTWVGEAGPELVQLPSKSQIYSNQESKSMTGDTFIIENITIPANTIKEWEDIIRIVKGQQSAYRRGVRVNV